MVLLKRYGNQIHSTERDYILLIKTVIQVEKGNGEIMHRSSKPIKPSTGRKMGKWERVNYLLPRKLQGKSRAELATYRCKFMFGGILRRYRAHLGGKTYRLLGPILTKPVLEILKKRDDLLNATPISVEPDNSLKSSSSPGHIISITNTLSTNDSEQPKSPGSKSSLHTHVNQWQSSQGQSMGTSTKQAASSLSLDHADESSQDDGNKSRETQSGGVSRSVRSQGDLNKSRERHNDPEDLGKPSVPLGARTRAQTSRKPPSGDSNSMRKITTSRGHTRYENLPRVPDEPLRRLDAEFSQLSSWLENHLIPLGERDFKQTTISAIRSSKRPKFSVDRPTEPFDNLLHGSQSRTVNLHIQTSFQNLRARLARLLKQTSVEVAQVFRGDTPFMHTSPDCSHGVKQS